MHRRSGRDRGPRVPRCLADGPQSGPDARGVDLDGRPVPRPRPRRHHRHACRTDPSATASRRRVGQGRRMAHRERRPSGLRRGLSLAALSPIREARCGSGRGSLSPPRHGQKASLVPRSRSCKPVAVVPDPRPHLRGAHPRQRLGDRLAQTLPRSTRDAAQPATSSARGRASPSRTTCRVHAPSATPSPSRSGTEPLAACPERSLWRQRPALWRRSVVCRPRSPRAREGAPAARTPAASRRAG